MPALDARRRADPHAPRRPGRQRPVPRRRPVLRRPLLHGRAAALHERRAIVATDDFLEGGPGAVDRINRLMTDGVVETPHGAHFTECVPDYGRDEAFQKEYAASAKSDEAWDAFRAKYLDVRRPRRVPEGRGAVSAAGETKDLVDPGRGLRGRVSPSASAATARSWPTRSARSRRSAAGSPRRRFEPELVMTDGEALLVANIVPIGVDRPAQGRRGVEPVPLDVRRRVVRPPPRDDGRQRRSTATATRTSRSSASCEQPEGAAARLPRRARQHDQRTRRATGSRTTRRRCSSRRSTS